MILSVISLFDIRTTASKVTFSKNSDLRDQNSTQRHSPQLTSIDVPGIHHCYVSRYLSSSLAFEIQSLNTSRMRVRNSEDGWETITVAEITTRQLKKQKPRQLERHRHNYIEYRVLKTLITKNKVKLFTTVIAPEGSSVKINVTRE